jgi:hypothetical protein
VDGDRLADPARLTAVATLGATARSCDLNAQNSYNLSENTGHLVPATAKEPILPLGKTATAMDGPRPTIAGSTSAVAS